jgi:quercetin dioxygenase-like cupin family protein
MTTKDEAGKAGTTNPTPHQIVRRHLLTAILENQKTVERVEIKEVTLSAGQGTGLHFHVCPVIGYVTEGAIAFQLEGQPATELKPGDAFFEPALARVAHFDNATGQPAKFIACYLMGDGDRELITML